MLCSMKHPDQSLETFEFNLGKAPSLRCTHDTKTSSCGACEVCRLSKQLAATRTWFMRAGDKSQQRFTLGLVKRLHSVDLLQYVISLLQPLLCKDFTYARTRTTPSLSTDRATMSGDRALCPVELEKNIAETWFWFEQAKYWTKSNFLLSIFQWCEAHLLHIIGTQARTLLVPEQKAFVPKDNYEETSVASTEYTYESGDHPELDLLSTVCSQYSNIKQNPFNRESQNVSRQTSVTFQSKNHASRLDSQFEVEIINDDSDDDWFGDSGSSLDPTCLVVPGSAKGYAGVAKYKDFIRSLPVHLSKYILGFLDRVTLFNCVCVSQHWRLMAEEVQKEFSVNQQVREEVMLMQGASAQGCNPLFAKDVDVAVPNIERGSWDAIRTGEDVIQTTYKSEVSFSTAYSGYSTRKIIMEERNVYCGAYNVMVLTDQTDTARVVDADGSNLMAVGSQDRKVRFLNMETGQEQPPVASGHAGSVRCVALCRRHNYVLSGSYDTSIRKWSLVTGKCEKIFRGHRDTVQCLKICGNKIVSGAKDHMCKVWLMETGKCIRTFKHRHAITAVAMGEDPLPEIVVSGCEGGRVKVWDLKSGQIIKRLSGHHAPVTDVKFDSWHIVSASKDGYALAWSSQGTHSRCLSALRHPKEVLCLEFMYLRVITGSADGKLRIWNILNGQCLRIMRGNSRSDPIMQLTAIGNTITINTSRNLLVLNFEPVDYDYMLENDKMPPLVQYSKYSDAPVRPQPYPYVRAQRMRTAGATNQKILTHDDNRPKSDTARYRHLRQSGQIPHSAKSLSKQSMDKAKRIQSASGRLERNRTAMSDYSTSKSQNSQSAYSRFSTRTSNVRRGTSSHSFKTTSNGHSAATTSEKPSRPNSTKSLTRPTSNPIVQIKAPDTDSDITEPDSNDLRRRVSWAFETPLPPQEKEMSLPDTKSLLRSQIRAKGEVVPPDFIYLAVNSIHTNAKPTEASRNMESNRREQELQLARRLGRPASSPGRVDPRTKVPVDELALEQFWTEDILEAGEDAEVESKISTGSKTSKGRTLAEDIPPPETTVIVTEFASKEIDTKPALSLHSSAVKSSIPRAKLIRPHTATVVRGPNPGKSATLDKTRPKSAAILKARPGTAASSVSAARSSTSDTGLRKVTTQGGLKTSSVGSSQVPMMMYSKDMKEKLEVLRQHRAVQQAELHNSIVKSRVGNVSKFNDPMRTHANFRLLTYEQVERHRDEILDSFQEGDRLRRQELEKQQREAWLARVKGVTRGYGNRKPKTYVPEIREYAEADAVY